MNVTTTSLKSRKLRIQSKNFYLEDDSLTKENSISTEVISPANRNLPLPALFVPKGIKSVLDNDSDDLLDNEPIDFSDQFPNIKRKRANSNCIKPSSDSNSICAAKTDEYQKKYKTEMCKNFQFKGICQWGDLVK